MDIIDLRSDTLTRPTSEMREAMACAAVGDDVFCEDPTVNRLEAMAAEITGKSAAMFVASGTMANLVSVLTHCQRGDEMILGDQAHIFFYEQGGSAALGGVQPRILPNRPDGTMALEAIAAAVRPDDVHFPTSRLIALENTHNRCMGTPLTADYTRAVAELAHANGMFLHVDGARIFNAAAALNVTVKELAAPADSLSFCLSKGLGAPVGSLVCGDAAFIQRARRLRKVVGGGMRQAGVLAAAGIVALTHHVNRLEIDHANARRLAKEIADIPGLSIDADAVRTNIVFFDVTAEGLSAVDLVNRLAAAGVRMLAPGPNRIRAVTHLHITEADIERVIEIITQTLGDR
ncbi:MAG: low-specificity L-threonine aldolase [Pseudomonadota bacterium]